MEMTERLTMRILESEEKNRKTTVDGQLALAALVIKAIKQQAGHDGHVTSNDSAGVDTGEPEVPETALAAQVSESSDPSALG
jgi:hypothetical protein